MSDDGEVPAMSDDDEDFGVEALREGEVRIKLGAAMAFEFPAESAAQLACLLLKKAGWEVKIDGNIIKAKKTGTLVMPSGRH